MSESQIQIPFIAYPQVSLLFSEMERCRRLTQASSEPQCMSIEGCSGAGKSQIAKHYLAKNPEYETETRRRIPVLLCDLPSSPTPKALLEMMLYQIGDPGASKGTAPTLLHRMVGYIRHFGIEQILIDEFSNIYSEQKHMLMYDATETLKMLIKEANVSIVVLGVDEKVSKVLSQNRQLSRLFAYRGKITPFV